MSQFSETMTSKLEHLGYPDGKFTNNYYTAQCMPGVGLCVASLAGPMAYIQFFPWELPDVVTRHDDTGHGRYARFICAKATATAATNGELFKKWPFETCAVDDILMIKCIIEETIKRLKARSEQNADDQNISADPSTGEAVE